MIIGTKINEVRDSCRVADFQDTLCGIDAVISKYDKTEVDLESNGLVSTLGQVEAHNSSTNLNAMGYGLNVDEDMLPTNSP